MIVFGAIYFFLMMYQQMYETPYTWGEAWPVGVGSYFLVAGVITLNIAVAYGKAGPSQALVQIQVIVQLVFEILVFGLVPNWLQFVGMAMGVAGACVISLGKA